MIDTPELKAALESALRLPPIDRLKLVQWVVFSLIVHMIKRLLIAARNRLTFFTQKRLGIAFLLLTVFLCSWWFYRLVTRPPEQLEPVYLAIDVQEVCHIFDVSSDDFCHTSVSQNRYTLEAMLESRFPPNETTYDQFVGYLRHLESRSVWCFDDRPKFAKDNCPPPNECDIKNPPRSTYECWFDFPESIGPLEIEIDRTTGAITSYFLTKGPEEST